LHGVFARSRYIVEFRKAEGESLAISIPGTEAAVIRHFQARILYGRLVAGRRPVAMKKKRRTQVAPRGRVASWAQAHSNSRPVFFSVEMWELRNCPR
jgi:hypothetical protein